MATLTTNPAAAPTRVKLRLQRTKRLDKVDISLPAIATTLAASSNTTSNSIAGPSSRMDKGIHSRATGTSSHSTVSRPHLPMGSNHTIQAPLQDHPVNIRLPTISTVEDPATVSHLHHSTVEATANLATINKPATATRDSTKRILRLSRTIKADISPMEVAALLAGMVASREIMVEEIMANRQIHNGDDETPRALSIFEVYDYQTASKTPRALLCT